MNPGNERITIIEVPNIPRRVKYRRVKDGFYTFGGKNF